MISVDVGEDPSIEVSRTVANIRDELRALGDRLVGDGALVEAGFVLAADRWLAWAYNEHRLRVPANVREPVGTVSPPPAAPRCKHEYGTITGKCIRCGAERKRKPRAPVAPPEGGAP